MKNKGGFISVEKIELSRKVQAKPTMGSPFFFEDVAEEPTSKFNIRDWISLHKIEAIGFGVLVIGAIIIASVY